MTLYNHAFTIAFEAISRDDRGRDITPEQFAKAILWRVVSLLDNGDEMLEAVGAPYDTFDMEECHCKESPNTYRRGIVIYCSKCDKPTPEQEMGTFSHSDMLAYPIVERMKIDCRLLDQQISALLDSNIDEDTKNGLHHLLGVIYDTVNSDGEIISILRKPERR